MVMNAAIPRFEEKTRRKILPLQTQTKSTSGGSMSWDLPTTGLLQVISLNNLFTIAGSLSAPNSGGISSIIKRMYARVNGGHFLFDMSGVGYNHLTKYCMFDGKPRCLYNDGLLAVTTGAKNLDAIIPIAFNDRDQIGFINLQNRSTQVTLTVEFEADATVATGATVTGTVTPILTLFEPPSDRRAFPDLSTVHQYLEDANTISGAGTVDYNVQLGGTISGIYQLTQGSTYSASQMIIQQSNMVESHISPDSQRIQFNQVTGGDMNLTGTALTGYANRIFYDLAGDDGMGHYGAERDFIDTNLLTSMIIRNTYVGACTLRTVREQILKLAA
jgi:hypothetical protein